MTIPRVFTKDKARLRKPESTEARANMSAAQQRLAKDEVRREKLRKSKYAEVRASDIKAGTDIDGRPSKRDTDPGPREKDSMLMIYNLD